MQFYTFCDINTHIHIYSDIYVCINRFISCANHSVFLLSMSLILSYDDSKALGMLG